jgi:hypothetical protein
VSQVAMRGRIMKDTRAGLIGETLQSEADCVMMEKLVRVPDCDKRDDHYNYGFRCSSP